MSTRPRLRIGPSAIDFFYWPCGNVLVALTECLGIRLGAGIAGQIPFRPSGRGPLRGFQNGHSTVAYTLRPLLSRHRKLSKSLFRGCIPTVYVGRMLEP